MCKTTFSFLDVQKVYYNVAMWLTNSEFPRTQTEYEDSFTFKMFLFQFINYYSYLIYIAFFKVKPRGEWAPFSSSSVFPILNLILLARVVFFAIQERILI